MLHGVPSVKVLILISMSQGFKAHVGAYICFLYTQGVFHKDPKSNFYSKMDLKIYREPRVALT